ncbi:MAG: dTDP-4-dehydrorhamnose 3,5-epimerase, partial [Bacteroidales bacterium]|nr:dTDP-4-dehydrorhamnose 3,5-epimerase [Bacteroidales bacterium]
MNIIKTTSPGLLIIEPRIFKDARGYFYESFSQREFDELIGPRTFVQDNESRSVHGVVRGLHFQKPPYTQTKVVRCVRGRILDVVVDIRKGSPTFGKSFSAVLSEENHLQLYIPKGFAHGFSVLSDFAVFQYKCDEFYHPEADSGIQALDPALGIDWLIPEDEMILSDKDK